MSEYKGAFSLNQPTEEQIAEKNREVQIKNIPIRNMPPFKVGNNKSSKYVMSEISIQTENKPPPCDIVRSYANDDKDDKLNFVNEVDEIWKKYKLNFVNEVPLPTNRKTREPDMIQFRNPTLFRRTSSIHQPEEKKTKWIYILGMISIIFFISILFFLFVYDKEYNATIILSTIFFILTIISYQAQKRRLKIPIPQFVSYTKVEAHALENPDIIESKSALFARQPTTVKSDSTISQSLNTSRSYSMADRATADVSKDQHGKAFDYDQSYMTTLKTLGVTSVAFSRYLNNMKSFISKTVLSKLVKEMHKDDPRIVSMLTVPGYERYSAYTKDRIRSLAKSHSLAGHFGDKGDRCNGREWTTDFPSDNQIVLHILDVFFSTFMNNKRKEGNNSIFTQKYIYIKKDPVIENKEDAICLCSDDWSHFYVKTMYKEGKDLQEFYVSSGRDSMYSGLTLFFWFVKEKKKFMIEGADLTEAPIFMDRVFSLTRFD